MFVSINQIPTNANLYSTYGNDNDILLLLLVIWSRDSQENRYHLTIGELAGLFCCCLFI